MPNNLSSVRVGPPFPIIHIPGFCGGGRNFFLAYSSGYITMVILDETEDTPRRVSVKKFTVQAHVRTPPGRKHEGTANFSWKKQKKKPEPKKSKPAAVKKK